MQSIESFGQWMRQRRKALDLTQARLADRVGCALVTIKKFEQETRRPSLEMAALLANALAIPKAEQNRFTNMARGQLAEPNQDSFYLPTPVFLQQNSEPSQPLFVGREDQLSRLQTILERAIDANTQFVLLRGEPGQGKTSLLTAFAREAEATHLNLVVATGICSAHSGHGDPFLPFRDLFDLLTCDLEGRWLAKSISMEQAHRLWKGLAEVVRCLMEDGQALLDVFVSVVALCDRIEAQTSARPEWRTTLQLLRDGDRKAAAAQSQHQLFEQVTRVFKRIALSHPLLLILDDLQWIDESSLALLFHLSRRLAGSRIMVLVAFRSNEVTNEHPLFPIVNEIIQRYGNVIIDLDERNLEQDSAFVDALVNSEPNSLPNDFCRQLFQHTAGHPLFTVEMLRYLQNHHYLENDRNRGWVQRQSFGFDALPPRIDAVIGQRIGTLPPDAQALLQVASVEGEYFTVQVVAAALDIDERFAMRQCAQLADQQRLLREHSHLHVDNRYLTRYQFSHALFQQYLYKQLSSGEQRLFHGAIGISLEKLAGAQSNDFAVILAYHYEKAGDNFKSSHYHFVAGKQAKQSSALGEAIVHYRSALDNWATDALSGRAKIIRSLATCLQLVGQQAEAIIMLEECGKLYRQLDNDVKNGDTRRWIARLYWELGRSQESWANYWKAYSILESSPNSVELAEVLSAIGQMYMIDSDFDQAIEWCERAIGLAQELNEPHVIAHAMNSLGASLVWRQEIERGIELLRQSIDLGKELGLGYEVCRAMYNLGGVLRGLGRYTEAKQLAADFLVYAQEVHAVLFVSAALTQHIECHWKTGDWEIALDEIEDLCEWQSEHSPSPIIKIWTDTLFGTIYNDRGLFDVAEEILWGQIDLIRDIDEIQLTLPLLGEMIRVAAQSASRDNETLGLIQELVERVDQTPTIYSERFDSLLFAHAWLLKQQQLSHQARDLASSLTKSLEQHIETYDKTLQIPLSHATYAEMQGNIAWFHQELNQAKPHYQTALAHWYTAKRPYDLLRTMEALRDVSTQLGVEIEVADDIMQTYARFSSRWQSQIATNVG